jgi:hypothetical protein
MASSQFKYLNLKNRKMINIPTLGAGYGFFVPHHKGFGCNEWLDQGIDAVHPTPPAGPAQSGVGQKLLGCDDDAYSGKLVRVNLEDFKTIDVIDLARVHKNLVGFNGGFTGKPIQMIDR